MNKKSKGIIIFLVILIIAIGAILGYTYGFNFERKQANTNQVMAMNEVNKENVEENRIEGNVIEENTIQNEVTEEKNNEVSEPVVEEKKQPETEVEGDNSETQADNDEEKAIAIVKKDWGDTTGVAFKVEQINANGTYIISVRNEDSVALEWYTVNPKTGKYTK